MVNPQTIDRWRNAPRLTSFSTFFQRTAGLEGGVPDIAQPEPDMSLLDFDLDCAVFAHTHARLFGGFDAHYYASIPYRLEEQIRLGAGIYSFATRLWARTAKPATVYTLGAGTGCFIRTLAVLGDGRLKTLCCSATAANRDVFLANRASEHAHFFFGPFFELDSERYIADPDLADFQNGFDILFEDTTFQMFDRDRVRQLEFIAPRIKPGGILLQVQKLAQQDPLVYDEREWQKDELFKTRYFSRQSISEKKSEILNTMSDCQVDLPTTVAALRSFFRYSVVIWNSGNFYTIASSNARASLLEFISSLVKPAIPPAYCYEALPLVLIDTQSQPIAPALAWRRANAVCSSAPGQRQDC